jgi:glycosyltransferase involved in cell wall biosynthesis
MKILLYTPVFFPMVGGMETVSESIADLLIKAGHECIVVTPIEHDHDVFNFQIHRNPNFLTKIKLILWADVVYSNGATLAILPLTKILRKPFVWKHAGYQASCIDGLGWVEGKKAPMNPWGSIKFHFKENGFIYAFTGGVKLFIRRFAAKYLVDMNVAITEWVAQRQPFLHQIQIYNPSPIHRFRIPSKQIIQAYDFVYLGRLVSEKGVKTLLNAFNLLHKEQPFRNLKLLIIGEGNKKEEFEDIVGRFKLQSQVHFAGRQRGQELTDLIHSATIAIVPSDWEEPMGIVALELMAAGRGIIVSEFGGLKECVGDAGLIFPNENYIALADCMRRYLEEEGLLSSKIDLAKEQLKKFEPEMLVNQYIEMFNKIILKS